MYKFYKNFLLLNLKDYPNINIDFPITLLLAALTLTFIAVIIIVNFRRSKMEIIIRELKRRNAVSEDSALTLAEIKLDGFIYRRLLSAEGQLSKMVSRAGVKKYTYQEYIALTKSGRKENSIDFSTAKFYLHQEGRERAERILQIGTPSLLNTVLLCIFVIAIFVCVSLFLPGILSFFNDYLGTK